MATEARLATIETISRNPQLNAEEKNAQILKLFEKDVTSSEANGDTVMSDLSPEQQVALITQNLQETLNPEILEEIVVKQRRRLVVYWGREKFHRKLRYTLCTGIDSDSSFLQVRLQLGGLIAPILYLC